jgi:hypothetical protein
MLMLAHRWPSAFAKDKMTKDPSYSPCRKVYANYEKSREDRRRIVKRIHVSSKLLTWMQPQQIFDHSPCTCKGPPFDAKEEIRTPHFQPSMPSGRPAIHSSSPVPLLQGSQGGIGIVLAMASIRPSGVRCLGLVLGVVR